MEKLMKSFIFILFIISLFIINCKTVIVPPRVDVSTIDKLRELIERTAHKIARNFYPYKRFTF